MSRLNKLAVLLINPERRIVFPMSLDARDQAFKKALQPPTGARRVGRQHLATVNQVGLFALASLDNKPGIVFALDLTDQGGKVHGFRGRVLIVGDVGHGPTPAPVDAGFIIERVNWAPVGIADLVVHNAPTPDCPGCDGRGVSSQGATVFLSNVCDVCGGSGKKPKLD